MENKQVTQVAVTRHLNEAIDDMQITVLKRGEEALKKNQITKEAKGNVSANLLRVSNDAAFDGAEKGSITHGVALDTLLDLHFVQKSIDLTAQKPDDDLLIKAVEDAVVSKRAAIEKFQKPREGIRSTKAHSDSAIRVIRVPSGLRGIE